LLSQVGIESESGDEGLSRARLRISWLMVCRRVSKLARHRGGTKLLGHLLPLDEHERRGAIGGGKRKITVTAATNGTMKINMASHFRLPHAARRRSTATPFCAGSRLPPPRA
jgi:hypothetical protein